MPRLIFRVLVNTVAVLSASLMIMGASAQGDATPVSPGEPGALVNGVSICPPNLDGASIDADDCTDPAVDVDFYAANPNTDNVATGGTGGDGLVSVPLDQFAISPDGATVEVGFLLDSDPYGVVTGYAVSCTNNGEAMDLTYVDSEVQPGGQTLGVQFTAFPGDQVSCEWYLSHAADGGDDQNDGGSGTGDGQSTGGSVTKLPTTGTGSGEGSSDAAALGGMALLSVVGAALVASRRGRSVER